MYDTSLKSFLTEKDQVELTLFFLIEVHSNFGNNFPNQNESR